MTAVEVFAPAKVNLTLHITGQRDDGYHLLDSLVSFGSVGDRLRLDPDQVSTLKVSGPEAAGVPTDDSNLVMQAARMIGRNAAIHLEKHLPPASGIGGGSSDAAAVLRGLLAGERHDAAVFLALGADVPMCLAPAPCRARGVGEDLTPVTLPPLPCLLVNPRVQVPTGEVFKGLAQKDNPPMGDLPEFADAGALIDWIIAQRNDLQPPAIAAQPLIGAVLDCLSALPGVELARMSGSGATCFALFTEGDKAQAAHDILQAERPEWWMKACVLGDQSALAAPQLIRATT